MKITYLTEEHMDCLASEVYARNVRHKRNVLDMRAASHRLFACVSHGLPSSDDAFKQTLKVAGKTRRGSAPFGQKEEKTPHGKKFCGEKTPQEKLLLTRKKKIRKIIDKDSREKRLSFFLVLVRRNISILLML